MHTDSIFPPLSHITSIASLETGSLPKALKILYEKKCKYPNYYI